ncbi:Lrp/AsnC family transcriptional regulator [Candidatus Bathyarchaeota archaeon]|nr:Lrp/AsnC family transcriptional regulator [Candidatus Bathyarchaeota archaeon]
MRELWGSPDIWHIKRSYLEIASKLGVDEETVRNRIKHLRESGFLLGYRLVPNPALLGRTFASLRVEFKDRESKEKAIPHLAKVDGVINIGSTYDTSVLVTLLAEEDQDFSKLIIGMEVEGEVSWVPGLEVRPTTFRMTNLDWEIVGLLLRDAERKLDEVAKQLRVSTRTVKRRINVMMRDAAILTMPIVDLRKTEGIPYRLRVEIEQDRRSELEKQIVSKIGGVVFKASDSQNGSVFGFTGANVAEGNDILVWVKQQPGVMSATMTIAERVVHVFDWIEGEVERRVNAKQSPGPISGKIEQTITIGQSNR